MTRVHAAATAPARRATALLLTGLVLAMLALLPGTARAHASLLATFPQDGASVATLDATVLELSEDIDVTRADVRIIAPGGAITATTLDLTGRTLTATPVEPLPTGSYLVAWRMISADGHPVGGSYAFGLGQPYAATTLGEVDTATAGPPRWVPATLGTLATLATLVALGAAALAGLSRDDHDRDTRAVAASLVRRAATLGLVATALAIPAHAAELAGTGLLGGLAPDAIGALGSTSQGAAILLRLGALVIARRLLRPEAVQTGADRFPVAALAATVLAAGTFAMNGHTRAVDPAWLGTVSDLVHLTAGAVWFGGLLVLGRVLHRRWHTGDAVASADLVARFSTLAVAAVVAVTASGTVLAVQILADAAPGPLGSSAYGRVLILKTALVAVVVALGAYNRSALVTAVTAAGRRLPVGASADTATIGRAPTLVALDPGTRTALGWNALRRVVRAEAGILVAVILLTGALTNVSPPPPATTTTSAVTQTLDDGAVATVTVTTDRLGTDRVVLTLTGVDADGATIDRTPERMDVLVALPELGVLARELVATTDADGVLVLEDELFPQSGRWQIDLVIPTGRFSEERVRVLVDVE